MKTRSINELYNPNDFPSIREDHFAYAGCLGKDEWERIAGYIIEKSKERGEFIIIKDTFNLDLTEMHKAGLLDYNEDGYTLTAFALEKLKPKTNSKNKRNRKESRL